MSKYIAGVCASFADSPAASPGQADLLAQCAFLQAAPAGTIQTVSGQQINALGPQTKKFGDLQQSDVTQRLNELRHDTAGVSVSGLSLTDQDGRMLTNGSTRMSDYLPVGSSGDGDAEFLDGRLGLFVNGSLQLGSKGGTKNSYAFQIKDSAITAGADYRIGNHFVIGAAYAGGKTITQFVNTDARLDIDAKGGDLYASFYTGNFYLDALVGYGEPRLKTQRDLSYGSPSTGDIGQEAFGSTLLKDFWSGLDTGTSFYFGNLALSPEASINYHEVRLSQFSESLSNPAGPGSGLGLTYGKGDVPSLQGRVTARAAYTFTSAWGVFIPDVHGSYIWEQRDRSDTFSVQFENAPASDMNSAAIIHTDTPEHRYAANGAGLSFQLVHGISGTFDYEQLRTLKTIRSRQFNFNIRYQL
jgi:outer membrane lipase/esterase